MTSLTLLATYDELVRCSNVLINGACEEEFLQFALNQEEMRQKWLASVQECQRLHSDLDKAHNEIASLDRKLRHARRNLEEEKRKCRAFEEQRDCLVKQIDTARDILFNDRGRSLNEETREKLQFLNNTSLNRQNNTRNIYDVPIDKLNTIPELNSTGSLLSDLNCLSRSEDDLETSAILQGQKKREWKEHRPSSEYSKKHRRSALHKSTELNSSDRIVATTTVVMPKEGTITASSTIEAIPGDENADPQIPLHNSRKRRKSSTEHNKSKLSHIDTNEVPIDIAPSAPKAEIITSTSDSEDIYKPSPNIGGYTMNIKMSRSHIFEGKTVFKSEICTSCGKRIQFGKYMQRCKTCRAMAHPHCKDLVPLPCIPTGNTPTLNGIPGTIADYTPSIRPMIPSIVVHCINEIELRGMNEQGLYRVNGAAADAKCLKEKFLKGKGAPNLSNVDISTICSTLKDFLRSLREPLITVGLTKDFVRATQQTDKQDVDRDLYQAISLLPPPNKDTLAFLMLHLQRVSSSAECKMPISNLAKVFGPTLVGYSSQEPSLDHLLNETKHQVAIVESLLQIPSDYWATFLNPTNSNGISTPKRGELKHTPSTESLLKRSISRSFFNTPLTSSRAHMRKNKKFFATPPSRIGN